MTEEYSEIIESVNISLMPTAIRCLFSDILAVSEDYI